MHNRTDYVCLDDTNELIQRLRLLMSSQVTGDPKQGNESISIIEELGEANIIYWYNRRNTYYS